MVTLVKKNGMARNTVAELLVDVLTEADVETVYGVPSISRGYHSREAALKLGLLNAEQFHLWLRSEEMTRR